MGWLRGDFWGGWRGFKGGWGGNGGGGKGVGGWFAKVDNIFG